eukprot:jgi/Mesvir1/21430/Mv20900-RA.2
MCARVRTHLHTHTHTNHDLQAACRDQRSHGAPPGNGPRPGAPSPTAASAGANSQARPPPMPSSSQPQPVRQGSGSHVPSAPPLPPDLLSLIGRHQANGGVVLSSQAPGVGGTAAATRNDTHGHGAHNHNAPHPSHQQPQHRGGGQGSYATAVELGRPMPRHASASNTTAQHADPPSRHADDDQHATRGQVRASGGAPSGRVPVATQVAGQGSRSNVAGGSRNTSLAGVGAGPAGLPRGGAGSSSHHVVVSNPNATSAIATTRPGQPSRSGDRSGATSVGSGGARGTVGGDDAARDPLGAARDGDAVEVLPQPGSLRVYDLEELGSGRGGVAEDSIYCSGGLFADVLQKAGGDVARAQAFMRELGISVGAVGSVCLQPGRLPPQPPPPGGQGGPTGGQPPQQQPQLQPRSQQRLHQEQHRLGHVVGGALPGEGAAADAGHASATINEIEARRGGAPQRQQQQQQQPQQNGVGTRQGHPPRPPHADSTPAGSRDKGANGHGSRASAASANGDGRAGPGRTAIGVAGSSGQNHGSAAAASSAGAAAPEALPEGSRQPAPVPSPANGPAGAAESGHAPQGQQQQVKAPPSVAGNDSRAPAVGLAVVTTVPKPGPLRQPLRPGHVFLFSYRALFKATDGFAQERVLGAGGFGKVYRGDLHGMQVAIKSLDSDSMQGEAEFVREVEVLGEYQQENIVRLVGYSTDEGNYCLVYEYMDGGSLQDRLAQSREAGGSVGGAARVRPDGTLLALTWRERLALAADCAAGLSFLHTGRPRPLVHCDVKSANVLLKTLPAGLANHSHSVTVAARIGDVGLCRLGKEIETSTPHGGRSAAVIGSFGYVDPVYMTTGQLHLLNDCFSFGVVLLELITGLPAVSPGLDPPFLSSRLQPCLQQPDQLAGMADKAAGKWPPRILAGLAFVASQCLEYSHIKRCSMQTASLALQDLLMEGEKIKDG